MFIKECIIYDNKPCDDCGDCNFCDINPDKICDNCGNCIDSYDYTGIQIEELILEKNCSDQNLEGWNDEWRFSREDNQDKDENIIYIDDVEGLSEEIQEHSHHDCCGH